MVSYALSAYVNLVSTIQAHNALMVEEEATALSVWAVACLCGSLRLEHVRGDTGHLYSLNITVQFDLLIFYLTIISDKCSETSVKLFDLCQK